MFYQDFLYVSRVTCHLSPVTCHYHQQPQPQTLPLLTPPLDTAGSQRPQNLKKLQNQKKITQTTHGHHDLETESAQWADAVKYYCNSIF